VFGLGTPQPSRYIRTSWMLTAEDELLLEDSSKIRFFSKSEAETLARKIQKRNVFARHSRESNFYYQRINEMANHTVIEIYRPGEPIDVENEAAEAANVLEKLAVLSSTLAMSRDDLQRKLGISTISKTELDFIIGYEFRHLRSRSRKAITPKGIRVDGRFYRRFFNCGFQNLYAYCLRDGDLVKRVLSSSDWLLASRRDSRLAASVVKTSIAFESLLVFSESETIARSLSERAALILSPIPDKRQQISKIIKRFYNVRSGVVHGSRKKLRNLTPQLVEAVDRLAVLLYLIIAANSEKWDTVDGLRAWCEKERWSAPSKDIILPFSRSYLNRALDLSEKVSSS